ncbi:unnamed protein product [Caenorhabditis auriculariae]|uniref:Uncharacterized protein n=1 Tax=Caenorhabditis auriculariae TaxID=2777116 RepID=A0A8S1H1S8_9PELO|nr:unnamed protein product [Caenorhabditis auriculariae]
MLRKVDFFPSLLLIIALLVLNVEAKRKLFNRCRRDSDCPYHYVCRNYICIVQSAPRPGPKGPQPHPGPYGPKGPKGPWG